MRQKKCLWCKAYMDISSRVCPHCGKPQPGRIAKIFGWTVTVLLFLGIFKLIFGSSLSQNTTTQPTQTAVQTKVSPTVPITPTPTPTDWIANPQCKLTAGESFDVCLRDKYPLKATVNADNTAMYITNTQTIEWTNCRVEQDAGNYGMNLSDTFTIAPGATARIAWGRLTDDSGNRLNYFTTQPGALDISCVVNHEQHESQYGGF